MMRTVVAVALVTLSMSAGVPAHAQRPGADVESVVWMRNAWNAYNAAHWSDAVTLCKRLITKYRAGAYGTERDIEAAVSAHKRSAPATGKIPQPEFVKIMGDAGPMTEVSTAYFVLGKSERALRDKQAAIDAFTNGAKYKMARAWDPGPAATSPAWNPQGWLWDVGKACQDELDDIKANGL